MEAGDLFKKACCILNCILRHVKYFVWLLLGSRRGLSCSSDGLSWNLLAAVRVLAATSADKK